MTVDALPPVAGVNVIRSVTVSRCQRRSAARAMPVGLITTLSVRAARAV